MDDSSSLLYKRFSAERLLSSVKARDFRGLRKLAAACGDMFRIGVVLYDGESMVPFGNRMFAAPISSMLG
jgi:hypothetical protein